VVAALADLKFSVYDSYPINYDFLFDGVDGVDWKLKKRPGNIDDEDDVAKAHKTDPRLRWAFAEDAQ